MGYNMNDFAGRVARYRQELAEITGAYDKAVQSLDDFKDSASYPAKLGALKAAHTAALDALRAEHRPLLVAPLAAMREEVAKKQGDLVVPDQRQLVLLQVLGMKSTVSRSELDRAAAAMQGCPMGLSVLDDLAEKHEIHGCHYNDGPDPDRVLQQIDQMETAVGWMLSAERHDLKYLPGQTPEDIRRTTLIQEHATAADVARRFGGVPTDELEGFESMVEIQA